MDRAGLRDIGAETLAILERGSYVAPSGRAVQLDPSRCVRETRTWRPAELEALVAEARGRSGGALAAIEVTGETTAAAARRLAADGPVLALNFASAVSVGGGFLLGARAQEEDLCRCSALYACLGPQQAYYAANRAARSDLYTEHMITSPAVPFFRDDALALLEAPFEATILTAPAPCARDLSGPERALLPGIFERRVAMVLALAAALGQRRLVLGAWGCGAFRNDAVMVADTFARALQDPALAPFERVVFGVFDTSPDRRIFHAFRRRLLPGGL